MNCTLNKDKQSSQILSKENLNKYYKLPISRYYYDDVQLIDLMIFF